MTKVGTIATYAVARSSNLRNKHKRIWNFVHKCLDTSSTIQQLEKSYTDIQISTSF